MKKIDIALARKQFKKLIQQIIDGKSTAWNLGKEHNLGQKETLRLHRAAIRAKLKKDPKYNNTIVEYDGKKFMSKMECADYKTLKLREAAGEISDIKTQESIYLTKARIQYIVDFSYHDKKEDRRRYLETKGFETDTWKLKKKLWKTYGPGPLIVHFGKGKIEEIIPRNHGIHCRLCGSIGIDE